MGKLQSTDYIFIIGLIVLIGIAGSIIYLITTAESVDPKDKEPGITIDTQNPEPVKTKE